MTPPFKWSRQPDLGDRAGRSRIGFPSRKNQNIGIVVLPAQTRRLFVKAEGGPHTGESVGGDRHPYTGAANQYPSRKEAGGDRFGRLGCEVGVIRGSIAVSPYVRHSESHLHKEWFEPLFELEAGMIRADDDFSHGHTLHLEFLEDQDGVHPAETKGVRHCGANFPFPRAVGNVIQIAIGIRIIQVDRRWKHSLTDRL